MFENEQQVDTKIPLTAQGKLVWLPPGLERMKLSGKELMTYILFVRRSDPGDLVEISYNEAAKETDANRKTAMRAIYALESLGMLERITRPGEGNGSRKNLYKVFAPNPEAQISKESRR